MSFYSTDCWQSWGYFACLRCTSLVYPRPASFFGQKDRWTRFHASEPRRSRLNAIVCSLISHQTRATRPNRCTTAASLFRSVHSLPLFSSASFLLSGTEAKEFACCIIHNRSCKIYNPSGLFIPVYWFSEKRLMLCPLITTKHLFRGIRKLQGYFRTSQNWLLRWLVDALCGWIQFELLQTCKMMFIPDLVITSNQVLKLPQS